MPKLPRVSGKEVARALGRAGFALDRAKGSHHTFVHAGSGREVVVPVGSRDLAPGTLLSILRQAGLTPDDLRRLLR